MHTWVAVKPANAAAYTVYEVIGWRLRWSDSVVAIHERAPDARWYGNEPELYADKRGEEAEKLIARIDAAARAYPYAKRVHGVAGAEFQYLRRMDHALGAGAARSTCRRPRSARITSGHVVDSAPSGGGLQSRLAGLFALTASGVEGLELNLLGLTFGINPFDPALKLPLVGRLGPARALLPGSADGPRRP